MARLVVVHPAGQDEELWIITDTANPVDASAQELIHAWPGRKRGIHRPKVGDYHAWQRQLRDRTDGGMAARCPECAGAVYVRPHAGDTGWHWYHHRRAEGCRLWRNETDAHFKLKNRTADVARELGLHADVEKRLVLADGTQFQPDVLITGGSQTFPLDWEVEETGHRNTTSLEDWYQRRELLTPRRVLEMTPASYRQTANVPQLLRQRDRIVDGLIDTRGNPLDMHRDEVVEAVCLGRVALAEDNQWRLLGRPSNWNPKLTPVAKPRRSDPRDVAGATPWAHSQPSYAQPGRPPHGAPTPSSSTATSSEPSTPWTQHTLFAEPSKNSQPRPPSPGYAQQLRPTGTDGTHQPSSARTAANPTPSAAAPSTAPQPTTAPALTVVPPTPPTPSESSPSHHPSRNTTTATAPNDAPSAANTTSPPTSAPATQADAATAATNSSGRAATSPIARSAGFGDAATPAPCRCCDIDAWSADIEGPAHPCCVMWARWVPGKPCQACAESRRYWRTKARRAAP